MSHHELDDFDLCSNPGCNETARVGDARVDLDYCSRDCADKHIQRLQFDAELERHAEISSGGQA